MRWGSVFYAHRPLVPLPKISHELACVKKEVVDVINHLLDGVWHGPGVVIRDCVVDLPPDDLGGVGGGVPLADALVVCKIFSVDYDVVYYVQVGEQIQRDGSSVTQVWTV